MSFPIRIKLKHKKTGLSFKEWAKDSGKSYAGQVTGPSKVQIMPCVNEQGNVFAVNFEHFYMSGEFLSPAEWELWVATEKEDGQWKYRRVGY